MLTHTNAYLKDNFGDESGVKIFTVQNIFDTFALVVAYEYKEAIRCCTFDALERDLKQAEESEETDESDEESDSGYCDTCKSVEPLFKLQSFKQFYGQHCCACYELIDDADEDDDESYFITVNMIKCLHECSPNKQRQYHRLCMQMLKKH